MKRGIYLKIAQSFLEVREISLEDTLEFIKFRLIEILEKENPNFNRERFLRACETGLDTRN